MDGDGDGYAPAGATLMRLCSCGAGTTSQAPDSPSTTDCDDTANGVHPGAAELCNRIDDNCSSGGGVDTAEDFDDDGHARSTAACNGGFDKDDCNDGDNRVFPGQTAYFTTPRCPPHAAVNPSCSGSLAICGALCSNINLTNWFDFNCNGSNEPQPEAFCRNNDMTSLSCSPAGCYGSGPTDPPSMTDCGQSVGYSSCYCDTGTPIHSCQESLYIPRFGIRRMTTVGCR